jgi:hypothetical protein
VKVQPFVFLRRNLEDVDFLVDSDTDIDRDVTWPVVFDRRCSILDSRRLKPRRQIHDSEGLPGMTYLDVVFNCGALPGENELRAIDSMREVYGIRSVRFNGKERTVRVEYDASRMKQDAVAKLLRQAGIDVREPVVLA